MGFLLNVAVLDVVECFIALVL